MKWIKADLVDDVTGTYDQTKTTIQGAVASKVINSETVLGPPLTKFIDVFSNTGIAPIAAHTSSNGRIFIMGTHVNGSPSAQYDLVPIFLYDFNFVTGVYAFAGRINVLLPNLATTTQTTRSIRVIDTGTTGWKIFITTVATVTINGGVFLVNNIDLADFVFVGFPTIGFPTGNNQKAVYFLQDPSNIGVSQLNIAAAGSILDAPNNKLYVHNGIAATHQYYVYDTSLAPTYSTASVSVSVASPGVVTDTGHTFLANDPVIFTAGTLPTGLTVGTVYFVRNPVPAVSYELSATSGGASINTTGSPSVGAVIGRAWGTTGSNWVHKTGNLPALTGTLIVIDSEGYAVPVAAPINGVTLDGNPCIFFATTSNLYLGLISELTSGATTWPSLTTSNILSAANEITAPTLVQASWDNYIDACTYTTNTSIFISKQVENNNIRFRFGNLDNAYYEGLLDPSVELGLVTISWIERRNGWFFAVGGTVGQRGIIAIRTLSDPFYEDSYIVTKVLDAPNSVLKFFTTWEQSWEVTGNTLLEYRTSGFGSLSGGWIPIDPYTDLSAVTIATQIQFKIYFGNIAEGITNPAQIHELLIGVDSNVSISDNWEFSDDFSDNSVPSRCAFRLKKTYPSAVPTLHFRAYDLSDAQLIHHNTVTNAANFEYSTDNGFSWIPLGTIPNTVGTLLRYSLTTPPGVDIRPGLKET